MRSGYVAFLALCKNEALPLPGLTSIEFRNVKRAKEISAVGGGLPLQMEQESLRLKISTVGYFKKKNTEKKICDVAQH